MKSKKSMKKRQLHMVKMGAGEGGVHKSVGLKMIMRNKPHLSHFQTAAHNASSMKKHGISIGMTS